MADKAEHEIPPGRPHIIERPRLTRLLDEAPARVIMLVAPAGYGKTTLARQWLANQPHAWYQGGASSADVAALGLGLAEAAEALLPDVGRRLREWLPTSREPEDEVHVIEQFLAEDLVEWPEEAWFVIDDYHLLSSDAAEDLIRRLFVSGTRRLLLTSRQRPAWASARALLYGTFFELGQSALAMNMDEANAVLAHRHAEAVRGLVALADGWPAVIGLAALTPTAITVEEGFPEELHDYLAEELFASLPEDIREGLCRLALVPIASRAAANALLEVKVEHVLAAARATGMFALQKSHDPSFHPLLRKFLVDKLLEAPHQNTSDAVTRAAEFLMYSESWDEAFSLIDSFDRHDLLDDLLSRSIVPLTKQGRLATIREWFDFARRYELASPHVDLAEAELAFRQGLHHRAEMLASSAAKALGLRDELKSFAYYRAGQSSYLIDKTPLALQHFRDAHETAQTVSDSRNGLWGQFIASLELERTDTAEKLEQFASVGPHDRDTTVRTINGKLILGIRKGDLTGVISEAAGSVDLVQGSGDPIVRSSFWHIYAAALSLAANYPEALDAVDEALSEIDSSSIEFARPHALLSRATANIGLRRYRQAHLTLNEIESSAAKRRDDYVLTNATAVRCRLLLQTGSPEDALTTISATWSRAPSRCMQAEFLATRAAALACTRQPKTALKVLDRAKSLSTYIEPQLLSKWVRATCSLLLDESDAKDFVRAAFERTMALGALDTFVFAYRLHPKILQSLANEGDLNEALGNVLVQANDSETGRSYGLRLPSVTSPRPATNLTPREQEVYSLLAEGKTNREIAAALVITEVTAKVHTRNVFRKLGVRSRTEAALKAMRDDAPKHGAL